MTLGTPGERYCGVLQQECSVVAYIQSFLRLRQCVFRGDGSAYGMRDSRVLYVFFISRLQPWSPEPVVIQSEMVAGDDAEVFRRNFNDLR